MDKLTKEQEVTWDKLKYVPPRPASGSYSSDGTQLAILTEDNKMYRYHLSTPWDVSTATLV